MIRCARCHRPMRAPSETGLGPKCQMVVLGRKPKPRRVVVTAARDTATGDLFEGVA